MEKSSGRRLLSRAAGEFDCVWAVEGMTVVMWFFSVDRNWGGCRHGEVLEFGCTIQHIWNLIL